MGNFNDIDDDKESFSDDNKSESSFSKTDLDIKIENKTIVGLKNFSKKKLSLTIEPLEKKSKSLKNVLSFENYTRKLSSSPKTTQHKEKKKFFNFMETTDDKEENKNKLAEKLKQTLDKKLKLQSKLLVDIRKEDNFDEKSKNLRGIYIEKIKLMKTPMIVFDSHLNNFILNETAIKKFSSPKIKIQTLESILKINSIVELRNTISLIIYKTKKGENIDSFYGNFIPIEFNDTFKFPKIYFKVDSIVFLKNNKNLEKELNAFIIGSFSI